MATNPFFNGGGYGWSWNGQPGSAYGTDYVRDYLSPEVPRGEYETYLSANGLGGFNRQSQFAQSLYNRTQQGYQAATLQNPNLSYRDYLNTHLGGNFFQNALAAATPEARGESPNRFVGRARVVGRA